MQARLLRTLVIGALVGLLSHPLTHACSGEGPVSILLDPHAVLLPPITNFESELRLVPHPDFPPPALKPLRTGLAEDIRHPEDEKSSDPQDFDEVRGLLSALPEPQREKMISEYGSARAFLVSHPLSDELRAVLPLDVALYLDGARLYTKEDTAGAVAVWQHLLDLPPDQRRHRSTWAAWMIARTLRQTGNPAAAQPWYQLCEKLSADGFSDPLHLGVSSLGWEARYALDCGDRPRALALYYQQAMAGDLTAIDSLHQIIPKPEDIPAADLARYAADPFLRGLITAQMLYDAFSWYHDTSTANDDTPSPWLDALEKAGVTDMAEAGRLAECAYSAGNFAIAKRWLTRAASTDPRALWIRGKIDLMEGRTASAEKNLSQAANILAQPIPEKFDPIYPDLLSYTPSATNAHNRVSQLYGDLGVTHLARDHFSQALTALYKGSFSEEASYLSERILSAEELLAYTRRTFPSATGPVGSTYYYSPKTTSDFARYLLARRLAREHYYKDARTFLPPDLIAPFDRYVRLLHEGSARSGLPKTTRAQSLWEAAQIHRTLGMELFGTANEPDNFPGTFWPQRYLLDRLHLRWSQPFPDETLEPTENPPFTPRVTPDETARANQSRLPYEYRYQYRYVAADLAWKAVKLMPDKSEDTARVLGIAGRWVQDQNPKFADRFYKALIWRNWSTPLAREADKLRWFPPIDWHYAPFAAAGVPTPEGFQ